MACGTVIANPLHRRAEEDDRVSALLVTCAVHVQGRSSKVCDKATTQHTAGDEKFHTFNWDLIFIAHTVVFSPDTPNVCV